MRSKSGISMVLLITALGCGGGGKKDTSEPVGNGDDGGNGGGGDEGAMVPPEKMDEIQVRLDRKRPSAARCLSDAVMQGKAPKNSKGKVALSFVVGPDGKAKDVKVTKTSINNDEVEQCVMAKVYEIAFPELPRPLEWSYIFALEAN